MLVCNFFSTNKQMNTPSFKLLSQELEAASLSECIERQLTLPVKLRDFLLDENTSHDELTLLKQIREHSLDDRVKAIMLMAALAEKLPSDVWIRYEFALLVAPHLSALSLLSKCYALANAYGAILTQNPDCIGFFYHFCAKLLEEIEPIQAMRLHSSGIAENNIHSYFRFIQLAQKTTGSSESFADTEAFNRVSREIGAPFVFENYVELSSTPDITVIGQYKGSPALSEGSIAGNRPFYLFRKSTAIQTAPPHTSYYLRSGYFSFDISREGRPEFYLLDEDKRPIRGLCYGFKPFAEAPRDEIANAAFIDDMFPGNNICHLLIDKLPRTALFEDKTNTFILFDHSPYLSQFASAFLPDTQFKYLAERSRGTIRCRELFISSTSIQSFFHTLHNGSEYARKFAETLRRRVQAHFASEQKKHDPQKIFISRRDAFHRNATNWIDLEECMRQRGYAIMTMSELEPIQQVHSLAKASHVVGIHGAGLTNILFSERCRVLEIFPSTYGSTSYWKLATILGHDYQYYAVKEPSVDDNTFAGSSSVDDNLTIDLPDFQRYMDQNDF